MQRKIKNRLCEAASALSAGAGKLSAAAMRLKDKEAAASLALYAAALASKADELLTLVRKTTG